MDLRGRMGLDEFAQHHHHTGRRGTYWQQGPLIPNAPSASPIPLSVKPKASRVIHLILLSSQIPQFLALDPHDIPIAPQRSRKQSIPPIHELLAILASRSEIDELESVVGRVVQEVCPVWVGLHESELEEFLEAKAEDILADLESPFSPTMELLKVNSNKSSHLIPRLLRHVLHPTQRSTTHPFRR